MIARLVRRGVVMREDLLGAGVGEGAIDLRLRRRRLHRFMGDGAYLVGHPEPPALAREHAAHRLAGADSFISHESAAVLWGLLPEREGAPVHVLLRAQRRSTRHVRFHRGTPHRLEQRTLHGNLRVVCAALAILQVAPRLDDETLERVVADALRRKLATERELEQMLERRRGARGSARLRAVLQLEGGPAWTRSKAEVEMLKLIRAAGLPAARVNRRSGGKERDLRWDAAHVIVEIDGFGTHDDRIAFEADRSRDTERAAAGWLTLRFTWRRIRDRPLEVVAQLSAALSSRS